jgi:transcriptional regulator with XRE-family HTH domain
MESIAPETCRAGRGLVGWSQEDLAREARVGLSTIRNFETRTISSRTGEPIRPTRANLAAMQRALEAAGVIFLDEDDSSGPGVRLRKMDSQQGAFRGSPKPLAGFGRR